MIPKAEIYHSSREAQTRLPTLHQTPAGPLTTQITCPCCLINRLNWKPGLSLRHALGIETIQSPAANRAYCLHQSRRPCQQPAQPGAVGHVGGHLAAQGTDASGLSTEPSSRRKPPELSNTIQPPWRSGFVGAAHASGGCAFRSSPARPPNHQPGPVAILPQPDHRSPPGCWFGAGWGRNCR